MDYERIYERFMSSSKNREVVEGNYYELHHITPKCLGGNNSKENTVLLTAREHFIAHKLLFKFSTGLAKQKMGYALHRMMCPNNSHQRDRTLFSRKYEELKRIYLFIKGENHPNFGMKMSDDFREKCSINKIGEKNPRYGKKPWNYGLTKETDSRMKVSEETRLKLSSLGKGRKHSEEAKQKISESHKGKEKSEEHRLKISNTLKGRELSDETKSKMSESKKGKPQKTIQCPHCLKIGGTTMYRWHFDNCKDKQ